MSHLGLGASFDIGSVIEPVNLSAGNSTGSFVSLKNAGGVAFVFYKAVGGATEAPTLVFRSSDAFSGGTPADLDVVTLYHKKEEATLDGDETWTAVTQSAGDITDADWDDANEVLVVAEILAADLPDGHEWVSVNIADTGDTAQVACVLAVLFDLKVKRAPANLAALST